VFLPNATTGVNTVLQALRWAPGDEIVLADSAYYAVKQAARAIADRFGVRVTQAVVPFPLQSPDEVTAAFAAAITPRTKVMEITHITNLTGQILPVKELVAMARAKGVQTIVDGAHAFAQFPFTQRDLGCDYYATSLHKWLLAPIGTGFLYVRRDRIPSLWPLMAGNPGQEKDIRKYEEIGTHPAANHNAIAVSLAFHRAIGAGRKQARLVYLRDRWAKRLLAEGNGRVKILTPLDSPWGGGLGFFHVEGLAHDKLGGWLMGHRIVQTPITHAEFTGIRVTPNVYTTLDEIDRFSELVLTAIKKGIT
jgi:selenocysteine lyase/cysteine desulfurase